MPQISFQLPDKIAETLLTKTSNQQSRIDQTVEFALIKYFSEEHSAEQVDVH